MAKLSLPTQFFLFLDLSLMLSFAVHLFLLKDNGLPLFENLIVQSYVLNGLLAAFIFGMLFRFRNKWRNQIGFLFMAGSLLKFVVFFLFFYPTYKADGNISNLEFAAFFVPYSIALFWETYFVSKLLKTLEQSNKKNSH